MASDVVLLVVRSEVLLSISFTKDDADDDGDDDVDDDGDDE